LVHKVRPLEQIKGTANTIYVKAIADIDAADGYKTLRSVENDYTIRLRNVSPAQWHPPLDCRYHR